MWPVTPAPDRRTASIFLTGDEPAIKALTDALGFRYTYDPNTKQFAHASGVMVATPDGRISRYLYGVDYAPRNLRLSVFEASERKIGSPVDELLLFCYHYDPATGKYGRLRHQLSAPGRSTPPYWESPSCC